MIALSGFAGVDSFDDLAGAISEVGRDTLIDLSQTFGNITQTFEDMSIGRCSIDASIGPDKQVGNGVGKCDDGSIFFFTMIDGT